MRIERKLWSIIQRQSPILALAVAVFISSAQTPTLKTRTKEDRERAFQESHRLTLNVQVTDDAGKPVVDLQARDFTVFDNNQPRRLASFHGIDGEALNDATEVVVLLDAVNSTPEALETEKAGIFKYLAQSHSDLPYPTSFALWSNGHLKSTGTTINRNTIGKAFVSMTKNLHSNACTAGGDLHQSPDTKTASNGDAETPQSGGASPAADMANCLRVHFKDSVAALDGIAQQLHLGGRTILIWIGPGWPLLSDAEFQRFTPKARQSYFEEVVNVVHDLHAAQITLDMLSPGNSAHDESAALDLQSLITGATSAETVVPGSLALPVLAHQTGGRVLPASNDVTVDLGKLLDDADWYYALAISPPPAQNGVERRSLEVKVQRPGVNIRTMTLYYTEP